MPKLPAKSISDQVSDEVKSSSAAVSYVSFIIIILVVFIASFAGGLRVAQNSQTPPIPPVEVQVSPTRPPAASFPISPEILQSSALSEWSLSVAGKVTAKTGDSFTLSQVTRQYDPQGFLIISEVKDGKSLKIRNVEGQTFFRSGQASPGAQLVLANLPVGKVVTGIVKVQSKDSKRELLGGSFTVIR